MPRTILLIAVLFSILATGIAMWRSRWAVYAMILLVLATIVSVYAWHGTVADPPSPPARPAQ